MAVDAEAHLERMRTTEQWHGVDAPVAGYAGDAAIDVDRVIEEHIVGQLGDAIPDHRPAARRAFAQRREHRRMGPDLRMAGHADMSRGKARMRARFDRGMTEAAIDPEAGDVMLVAERHELVGRPADLALVGRSSRGRAEHHQADHQDAQDDKPQSHISIEAWLEDLRHGQIAPAIDQATARNLRQHPMRASP
jgi:hypothetical protein